MTSLAITARRINKKELSIIDIKALSKDLQRANKTTAELMKRDFQGVVATWVDKPIFIQKTSSQKGNIIAIVYTESDKFRFLDKGTRVRYATMSPDFQAKTRPSVLKSYSGAGRVLFVDRSKPKPGIVARRFTILIVKKRRDDHIKRVDLVLKEATNE